MPLYEYRCRKCGASLEKIQKFSDRPLTRCEKCGGRLERVLSPSAIQFKGSGFYVNDYARSSSGRGSKDDGSSSGKGESAASETKKAKPSEAKPGKPEPVSKK